MFCRKIQDFQFLPPLYQTFLAFLVRFAPAFLVLRECGGVIYAGRDPGAPPWDSGIRIISAGTDSRTADRIKRRQPQKPHSQLKTPDAQTETVGQTQDATGHTAPHSATQTAQHDSTEQLHINRCAPSEKAQLIRRRNDSKNYLQNVKITLDNIDNM